MREESSQGIDLNQINVKQIKKEQKVEEGQVQEKIRVKSKCRIIVLGLIISISALQYGYGIKEITSIPIETLIKQYNITLGESSALSILVGIIPFGALFGSIITIKIASKGRRVSGIYVFAIINVVAVGLANITVFWVLIIAKFIQGICIGFYSALAPIYLKEIAPKEMRRMMGLFFSLGKIVGVLLVIAIQFILEAANVDYSWRIILSLTGVFAFIQAILVLCFGSDTPSQNLQKGKEQEAMQIIKELYKPEYVDGVFLEYKRQYEMQLNKDKAQFQTHLQDRQSTDNLKPNSLTIDQKKKLAFIMAVHLSVVRNFTGGNTIISLGGIFVKPFDEELGKYIPLIINIIQFIFVAIGLFFIQKIMGKRNSFLISLMCLALINFSLTIAMVSRHLLSMIFLFCIYMAVFGAIFISQAWAYPSEVIPAKQALGPNIAHWLSISFSFFIPPLVVGAMPDENPFPVFIFFGIYCLIGFFHVQRYLRQSDGYSYDEIIESYK